MDVFELFATTGYKFLQLGSNVHGNYIVNEYDANGVVKLRDGMEAVDNVEERESTSTVHIRPSEPFIALLGGNLVGHGIQAEKDGHGPFNYRIEGQVEGRDFDTGELAFYRVTLKREDVATWDVSELPLT